MFKNRKDAGLQLASKIKKCTVGKRDQKQMMVVALPRGGVPVAREIAEKLQTVIDQQINPALALHGGFVKLVDVQGTTAYIELGGGCRGCGMVDVTLKQGIEVMIKQSVPEITEILDSTDHASGRNPYYQPSK